jgi:predicted fused transcriptional regulator/phosphomethylpyrimidine kinase/predicted transcriptional regulator
MYPPCVEINRYLLPETRKRIAKNLKKNGIKEKEIAKVLHISQGMVSRYLNEDNSYYLYNEIEDFSNEMTRRIIENYGETENLEFFCNFCISIRESGKFCDIHKIDNCTLCKYLYNPSRKMEDFELSNKLKSAVNTLGKMNISELIPEVRINIAYSRENPKSRMDVMAFPGRLTYISGRLVYYSEPQFGASKHLASILLNFKQRDIRAIINLRFNEGLISRVKMNKMLYIIMDREKFSSVEEYVKNLNEKIDFLVDPGTFGIEPMLYVFGKDPEDLINKIKIILG